MKIFTGDNHKVLSITCKTGKSIKMHGEAEFKPQTFDRPVKKMWGITFRGIFFGIMTIGESK